jgi:TRAP-type mannitol/chloroaromatic compound transport system substrate-binding protein
MRKVGLSAVVLGFVVAIALAALPASAGTINWKGQSTWTAGDFHHNDAKGPAEKIEAMSGGRLKINMQAAGAIVPAFEVLDATHKGILDVGHGWPGYWYGKHPAATLFGSVPGGPFGMNAEDFLGWMYLGGGIELYNELMQKELKMNVVVFPTYGETPEPLGWFKGPLKDLKTFKGLKFRAGGMSAEVFKAMGMTVVTLPGGEIVPALERGVIDAAEYSDPSSDMSVGFADVRKFYHLPSVHQPTGIMELMINKKQWDTLPADLKAIVENACQAMALKFTLMMLDQNSKDLKTLVEKKGVTIIESPREILQEILVAWDKVAEKYVKENPFFAKVYASQKQWAERIVPYRSVAHPPYDIAADHYWGKANPYKVQKPK